MHFSHPGPPYTPKTLLSQVKTVQALREEFPKKQFMKRILKNPHKPTGTLACMKMCNPSSATSA